GRGRGEGQRAGAASGLRCRFAISVCLVSVPVGEHFSTSTGRRRGQVLRAGIRSRAISISPVVAALGHCPAGCAPAVPRAARACRTAARLARTGCAALGAATVAGAAGRAFAAGPAVSAAAAGVRGTTAPAVTTIPVSVAPLRAAARTGVVVIGRHLAGLAIREPGWLLCRWLLADLLLANLLRAGLVLPGRRLL